MQIGVFGNADSWYVDQLCQTGHQRGHTMFPLRFEQFSSVVGSGGVEWWCADRCLNELDAVIVRTMPPGTLEQVVSRMDLLNGLEAHGIRIVNPPRALECAVDKYLTTQRLAQQGLPVPETVVCETAETGMEAFERLGGDVLVKPLFGAEGRGIIRVSDPSLALRALRTLERLGAVLYIQKFLNGSGDDLRILLLGDALVGSMRRSPCPGEFRANLALQGTATAHQPTPVELELARAAATAVGSLFAGVDLMYDADGRLYVIEVNAVPGWKGLQQVCRVDVADRLLQWIEDL